MVKVGTTWDNKRKYFACDECGICEQFERRMNIANELGECLQFDHCSCDKIDAEFFAGGYCEDAIVKIPKVKSVGKRKTGRAYRRNMHKKVIQKYRSQDDWICGVYISGHWEGNEYILGSYVKRPKSSANKVFFKRVSNKKVRRNKYALSKGNGYRKIFDYWWTID